MIRPGDQAKLLFLYFLRSSAALATSESTLSKLSSQLTAAATTQSNTKLFSYSPDVDGHISLRLATRTDVPFIQRCNLATLPENYSSNFYVNHIRQWPDLALVAEHIPAGRRKTKNPFESYDPNTSETQIIGYVLGKVEEAKIDHNDPDLEDFLLGNKKLKRSEMLGHVTSLAILKPYRRKGLAANMMQQLHHHMRYQHSAEGVGLHVRVSNIAARRLYCEGMGYAVVDVIRGYYQDGEDAFFMRKNLTCDQSSNIEYEVTMDGKESKRLLRGAWSLRNRNVKTFWEHGPKEFRLPRMIGQSKDQGVIDVQATQSSENSPKEEDSRQVMTGRL